MFDHARLFLDMVLPWEPGVDAWYNLHWKGVGPNGVPFWAGRAHRTLDEYIGTMKWICNTPDPKDFYVCMSSQARAEVRASKKGGRGYLAAIRFAETAVKVRSFFVDIDVKPKAYPTHEAAVAAFGQFLVDSGMPDPSAVVATGSGGFHVHWCTEELLDAATWAPYANALARMVQHFKLHSDTQCTVDIARILRIPETFNHKTTPATPTVLMGLNGRIPFETLRAILEPYIGASIQVARKKTSIWECQPPARRDVTLLGNELVENISEGAPPVNIDNVAVHCAFINEALTTGGAAYQNPLWFLTTQMATYSIGGRADAHRMASGHPGYFPPATDEIYDRVTESRSGWPGCQSVEAAGYEGCKTCPHQGLGKSPLHFSYDPNQPAPEELEGEDVSLVPPEDAIALPALPPTYHYDTMGYICRRSFDENMMQTTIRILDYPMLSGWLHEDPWTLHFYTRIHSGKKVLVNVPLDEMSTKDGVGKIFGRQGMPIRDKSASPLREFLVSWIKQLQEQKDAVTEATACGWSSDNGFAYSGTVYLPGATRVASTLVGALGRIYGPKGSIDPWLRAARIITDQKRPELNTILAVAFGGPLIKFSGEHGVLVSAYSSHSGIGKTTTMRVAQAVWGHPMQAMQGLDDTQNSVFGKTGKIKSLPLFWDEIKTEGDIQRFVKLAFQLAQGRERSRMGRDLEIRDSGEWKTMLCAASNDALFDAMSKGTQNTAAGVYRLFEFPVSPGNVAQGEMGVVSRAIGELEDNYGNAGLIYAEFIGRHRERVAAEVAKIQDTLVKVTRAGNPERFWIITMACILAGAKFANELKLTEIDMQALKTHLINVLVQMRAAVTEAPQDMANSRSVLNILSHFINSARARHTLITNKINQGKGRPTPGEIKIKNDVTKLDGIYLQQGLDDKILRVSSRYMSEWLVEQKVSRSGFTRALKEDMGAKIINAKLGSGTDSAMPMEHLIEIDLKHPALKDFVEDRA